ncbi:MAG: hypothetical protein IPM53_20745 [Anaerolineaceae bacterium]|nr:hypothetical protein [Anaerolineaceae bacterium]
MTKNPKKKKQEKGGIHIGGNVGAGAAIGKSASVSAENIAGRDIILGGQPIATDKEPTVDEFKQLLAEITAELAEVTAEKEILAQVAASAPLAAQGAEAEIKDASAKAETEVDSNTAESIEKSLKSATMLLTGILDGAKAVAEKAVDVASTIPDLAKKLAPLVDKVAVAALWAAKLWPLS